jgi:hypothetical protein
VRPAACEQDIERYCHMYEQTVKRWGGRASEIYPRELFLNLYLQKDPTVHFMLAELEGSAVAGVIALAWNKNIVYWHGCALQEYFKCYPNNVLHAAILERGCSNGFEAYDMGPSMELEGVITDVYVVRGDDPDPRDEDGGNPSDKALPPEQEAEDEKARIAVYAKCQEEQIARVCDTSENYR